jgi:hypothetical protein
VSVVPTTVPDGAARTAIVPRPKFVLAVAVLDTSDRLLTLTRKPLAVNAAAVQVEPVHINKLLDVLFQ